MFYNLENSEIRTLTETEEEFVRGGDCVNQNGTGDDCGSGTEGSGSGG